ncbi:MAG: hypothetical protein K2K02_09450, partial [Ruminococcus sp.]|nr:hypothetical protein [Ruminococcus sp.]
LNQLSQLRENGEYDDYSLQTGNVIAICTEKGMCSYALSLIEKQKHNSDEELDMFFAEEESQLKDALTAIIKSEDVPESKIITMSDVIHESGKKSFFSSIIQNGTVAQDKRIKSGLSEIFDKIRNSIEHIYDIISEKISSFHKVEKAADELKKDEKNIPVDNKEKSEKNELIVLDVYNMYVNKHDEYIEFLNTSDVIDSIKLQTGLLFEQQKSVQEHSVQQEQVQTEVQKKSKEIEYGD